MKADVTNIDTGVDVIHREVKGVQKNVAGITEEFQSWEESTYPLQPWIIIHGLG